MSKWTLFGISGHPSYEVTKSWLENHDIPFEKRSIFSIKREEIDQIKQLTLGGIKDLVYPDTFSYLLVNPLKSRDKDKITQIQGDQISEEEAIELLTLQPYLMITPILTDFNHVLIGYDSTKLSSSFRNVTVKDVRMA